MTPRGDAFKFAVPTKHLFLPFFILLLVPIIEKHPESCTVQLGKDCKLFCHVTGKSLKYRWYRRSRCLEGEVSNTPTTPKVILTNIGHDI